MPRNPAAWIITTARNRAIDRLRSERSRSASEIARLRTLEETAIDHPLDEHDPPISDERLGLIFACCHPALSLEAQAPS